MKTIQKNKKFYSFIFLLGISTGCFIFSPYMILAEEKKIEISSSYQLYQDVEKNFTETLPQIRQEIESTLKNLSSKSKDLGTVKIKLSELESIIARIRTDQNFNPLSNTFDKILNSISQAEEFLREGKIEKTKTELHHSAVYLKILAESPVLKMTEAQIDLEQSNEAIRRKDYLASDNYLKKSIEHIEPLLSIQNPKIVTQLQKIKNDLVSLHQQTLLGKHMEELKERSIWKRMQQAQVESLAHYYDLWSRTYRPWE